MNLVGGFALIHLRKLPNPYQIAPFFLLGMAFNCGIGYYEGYMNLMMKPIDIDTYTFRLMGFYAIMVGMGLIGLKHRKLNK